MSYLIAVCGPDGAGKSTLVDQLAEAGFETQYGGKKSNHQLSMTRVGYRLYERIDRSFRSGHLSHLYLLVVFYPLEYLENRVRVKNAMNTAASGTPVCFDRFVVDRMLKRYVHDENPSLVQTMYNKATFLYSYLYRNHFPSIDGYVFLVPPTDTLLERTADHYKSQHHANRVRVAYVSVAMELRQRDENVLVLDEIKKPEHLLQQTLDWIHDTIDKDESE